MRRRRTCRSARSRTLAVFVNQMNRRSRENQVSWGLFLQASQLHSLYRLRQSIACRPACNRGKSPRQSYSTVGRPFAHRGPVRRIVRAGNLDVDGIRVRPCRIILQGYIGHRASLRRGESDYSFELHLVCRERGRVARSRHIRRHAQHISIGTTCGCCRSYRTPTKANKKNCNRDAKYQLHGGYLLIRTAH